MRESADRYDFLLKTPLKRQWEAVSTKRRAGVIFPLFSIYSRQSAGVGEFPDIKMAVDWCKITGNSILQLLPLNDTGSLSSPFFAQTSIGLNPIHLSLSSLIGTKSAKNEERQLKKRFPNNTRVNYKIGAQKVEALRSIFRKGVEMSRQFKDFNESNKEWLDDFSLFRALKRHYGEKPWKKWDKKHRERKFIWFFAKDNQNEIIFWKWVQWQAFEQLSSVKKYAEKNSVLLKGDLPLFVSDDSADCWSNRKYFKMDFLTGVPPDDFSKKGQVWGMPPYKWSIIIKDDLELFQKRISYAENFYHLFRIDHLVGIFRTWVIKAKTKSATDGQFNPLNQKNQIKRGQTILKSIIKESEMLPCAEDLGTVPDFCREIIKKIGIPGLDVGRCQKKYRLAAVATPSTHDMDLFPVWIKKRDSELKNLEIAFSEVLSSPSIFYISLIFDWLFFSEIINPKEAFKYRINKPGTNSPDNWSARLPFSMEELIVNPGNKKILLAVKNYSRKI